LKKRAVGGWRRKTGSLPEKMILKKLIRPLKGARVIGGEQAEVTGICIDSRVVAKGPGAGGPLFAAIPGEHADGHEFIAGAASAGACAILASSPAEGVDATQVIVDDVRAALSIISDAYYGKPSREIAVARTERPPPHTYSNLYSTRPVLPPAW